jgi:hypothetical protein
LPPFAPKHRVLAEAVDHITKGRNQRITLVIAADAADLEPEETHREDFLEAEETRNQVGEIGIIPPAIIVGEKDIL